MNKIRKRTYRGIEYIKLSDLSDELQRGISNWLSDEVLIKIKTDQGIQRDCIQIKDFVYWYETLYTPLSGVPHHHQDKSVRRFKKMSLSLEG